LSAASFVLKAIDANSESLIIMVAIESQFDVGGRKKVTHHQRLDIKPEENVKNNVYFLNEP
jgi:hypothetical protein